MGLAKIYPYYKFEVSSFIRSKFTEGDLKFKKSALEPDDAPFEGRPTLLCYSWDGLTKIYMYLYTKFEVTSFTRSRFTEGGLKFYQICPWTLSTPFWGYFVVREMGLAKIYACTKFEVSSLTFPKIRRRSMQAQAQSLFARL